MRFWGFWEFFKMGGYKNICAKNGCYIRKIKYVIHEGQQHARRCVERGSTVDRPHVELAISEKLNIYVVISWVISSSFLNLPDSEGWLMSIQYDFLSALDFSFRLTAPSMIRDPCWAAWRIQSRLSNRFFFSDGNYKKISSCVPCILCHVFILTCTRVSTTESVTRKFSTGSPTRICQSKFRRHWEQKLETRPWA